MVPDWSQLHQELKQPGVTLSLLWLEYRARHPDGYGYSQFCERYRRWARALKPSMRQVHRAGEKLFVDFSGKRPSLVDATTGAVVVVELFVGVLGASGLIYAEATRRQDLAAWVSAHVRMVEYFGGSPAIWVPDNLKSGVTTANYYEPEINRTYTDLARHDRVGGRVTPPVRPHHRAYGSVHGGSSAPLQIPELSATSGSVVRSGPCSPVPFDARVPAHGDFRPPPSGVVGASQFP